MSAVLSIVAHGLRRRRTALIGWCLACAALVTLLAVAYPTVRGDTTLDATFAGLSPGVQQLLGLTGGDGITSPVGYLNSQFFTNVLPVMLLALATSAAAWAIAGDEAAGTLELLLANPVSRSRVALSRAVYVLATLAITGAATALALLAAAPRVGLAPQASPGHLVAATLACVLMALAYAAMAFAVAAGTGNRAAALATAAGLAVIGYVTEGLAPAIRALRPVRALSPWHWMIAGDPLASGLTWQNWAAPVVVAAAFVVLGTVLFAHRDLH